MKRFIITYLMLLVYSFFFYTNAQASSSKHNLQIINVNTENYPEAIFVEFTVTDSQGDFVPNLTVDDFIVKDNGTKKYGCKRLVQDLSELRLPVDIVFLVDNSGSMEKPQKKVDIALPNLLNGFKEKGEIRVALGRYGQTDYNPNDQVGWAEIEKNDLGFSFLPLRKNTDVDEFLKTIWKKNIQNGGYEPYYNVLHWAAQQDFGYRQNALKVFIMIGDESYIIDSNNNPEISEEEVTQALSDYGIQTFIIQNFNDSANYKDEYDLITKKTQGAFYDINAASYDGILTNITDKIKGRYILRYCVEEDEELNECKDIKESSIVYEDEIEIRPYYPVKSATIERTESTRLLDDAQIQSNSPIELSVIVNKNGNNIDKVSLFYRSSDETTFTRIDKSNTLILSDNQTQYTFSIPQNDVKGTHIY
ncbi:MAG: VWA domain-containing protein, partial [Paludibacteraceae bacterium]|nr:VWA domain-containing protein [Paludibacteraceae bacterium]